MAAIAIGVLAVSSSPARAADGIIISTGSISPEDTRKPLNGTQVGLATNLPGGKWVWGGGWNWGEPYVPASWDSAPQSQINLAEEKTALAVSLASAESYVKPAHFHISAEISVTGNPDGGGSDSGGGLGFWSSMPGRDDQESSLTHFTGLNLMLTGDLQVYEDGNATGSPVKTAAITPGKFYTLAFDVDTTSGAISNVIFDGKPVAGLSSTAFKDAATAFAGFLSRQGAGVRAGANNFTVSSPDVKVAPASAEKPAAK